MSEKNASSVEQDAQASIRSEQDPASSHPPPEQATGSTLRDAIGISCACCSESDFRSPTQSALNLASSKSHSAHSSLSEKFSVCGRSFANVMGSHRWRSKKLKAKIASDYEKSEKGKTTGQDVDKSSRSQKSENAQFEVEAQIARTESKDELSQPPEQQEWETMRPETEEMQQSVAPTPNNSPVADAHPSQSDPLLRSFLEDKLSPISSTTNSSKISLETDGMSPTYPPKKSQTKCCHPITFKDVTSDSSIESSSTSISKYEKRNSLGHQHKISPYKSKYNRSLSNSSLDSQDTFEYSLSLPNYQPESLKLLCKLCKKPFEDPRLLPCLHTFCSKCLDQLEHHTSSNVNKHSFLPVHSSNQLAAQKQTKSPTLKFDSPTKPDKSFLCLPSLTVSSSSSSSSSSPSKEKKNVIVCPSCDMVVDMPAEGAQQFPVNYIVKKQLRRESLNKVLSQVGCDLCNTESRATLYCTNCAASLCSFCSEAHKRQRKTSEHNITTLHEARKQGIIKKTTSIFCPFHPQEELKMFCETCVKTVCRDCVIVTHREHRCHFVSEVSDRQMALLRSALVQMQPCADNLKKWIENTRLASKKVEIQVAQTEEEINQFIAAYIQALQQHCENLLSDLKIAHTQKQENLTMHRIQLEQALEDLEHSFSFTNELLECGSSVEILSLIGPLLKRLQDLRKIRHFPDLSHELNGITFLRFEKADSINGFPLIGLVVSEHISPSQCFVKGDGLLTARDGHKSEIFLITRDAEGSVLPKGGDEIKAELVAKDNPLSSIPVQIIDRQDGSYVISFCPDNPGVFLLHIAIQGKPLQGSPFEIPVKPKWKKHTGVFHCCSFCSSGGSKDAHCACKGTMPGGYRGCGHGHRNHPGQKHWSCCGKLAENSECSRPHSVAYQFTL